ncbi:MAG: histidinol-phosphate transaminase [Spirochaetes bacterium]|nr:histidinol-phosphate transaminase [Spirochaetota bacterium]
MLPIPEYIAGKDINDIKRLYGHKKVIKLASNENPFGVPSYVKKTIKKNIKNVFRYPDKEYKELRRAIAGKIGLGPENIIPGNGTDEIIDLVYKYRIKPSSRVLLFDPSYSLYRIYNSIYSAETVSVKLDNYQYNVDKILDHLSEDISLVVICNPNNPTGTYLNQADMVKLVENLNKDTMLLMDEAYFHYATASDFPASVQIFKKYRDKKNIFITRTFSKIYALAGLRVGYGLGNKDVIDLLDRMRMPFDVNTMAQAAVLASLKNDRFIDQCKNANQLNREFFYSELDRLDLQYIKSQSNFVLIDLGRKAEEIYEKLLSRGIIVRPFYEKTLDHFIRVTVGKRTELRKLIKELENILRSS